MQRVVCDVGVVISGLLSGKGAPAALLDLWQDGAFDLVVSALWIAELDRVAARPKISRYVAADDAAELRDAVLRQALVFDDPPAAPGPTPDPGDDYIAALARASHANLIVSGDRHLLGLSDPHPPAATPRPFLDDLSPRPWNPRGAGE